MHSFGLFDRQGASSQTHYGLTYRQLIRCLGISFVFVIAVCSIANAGTGGAEFDTVNNRIVDMVEGGGGKLAAGLGLVAALAASVIRFNIWSVIGAFGVGAMAGYGIPIVTSSISATI